MLIGDISGLRFQKGVQRQLSLFHGFKDKQNPKHLFSQSLTYFLNAGITGMHYCAQLYVVLGIEPKASCVLGKYYLLIPTLPVGGF